jgi:hypothetical protein
MRRVAQRLDADLRTLPAGIDLGRRYACTSTTDRRSRPFGRGELEAYKIGKEWRVRRDHLDEAIEARRVGGQSPAPGGLWDPIASEER